MTKATAAAYNALASKAAVRASAAANQLAIQRPERRFGPQRRALEIKVAAAIKDTVAAIKQTQAEIETIIEAP